MQSSNARIAIIGAGITGIACAHALRGHGYSPTILEKSRGTGGRLAMRRTGDGMSFDHGGQYLSARSGGLLDFLESAAESDALRPWSPLGKADHTDGQDVWHVGVPGMSALLKPFCADLDIRLETQVRTLSREAGEWSIASDATDALLKFDILVCTAPAPQARKLLAGHPEFESALASVTMAPCWAAMLAFPTPLAAGYEVRRNVSHSLEWIARDSSKPGRSASPDCWVVHAGPRWSLDHLEQDREDVAQVLFDMFAQSFPGQRLPAPVYSTAHRWRYARTATPLGRPFLASKDSTLYAGGDWCLGASAESGFVSGRAIADAVADHLADKATS